MLVPACAPSPTELAPGKTLWKPVAPPFVKPAPELSYRLELIFRSNRPGSLSGASRFTTLIWGSREFVAVQTTLAPSVTMTASGPGPGAEATTVAPSAHEILDS